MKPFKTFFFCLIALCAIFSGLTDLFAQGDAPGLPDAVSEARGAGIPDAALNRLLALGYEKRVESESMLKLVRLLSEAKKENLPVEPFVSKIEEGMAKQVPAASIARVLTGKLDDYRYTRSILENYLRKHGLRQEIEPQDLVGIAESLHSGNIRQDLTGIVEQAPAASVSSLSRALNTLASLKQAGFDPTLSKQVVSTGLKNNFFTPRQRDFVRVVIAGKKKGIPDSQIAAAALLTMENKSSVESFRSQIGVSESDMGRSGPMTSPPADSKDGAGRSSGTGNSGISGRGGGSSGMGGMGGMGGTGGAGRGGGGGGRGR